jgi:hypothetical protein
MMIINQYKIKGVSSDPFFNVRPERQEARQKVRGTKPKK